MIQLSNEEIRQNHKAYVEAYLNSSTVSFLEDKFIEKSFPILEKQANRSYPYTVKIPKSIPELLRGDFEPSQIITIEEPVQGLYGPMWFGDSSHGVALRGGYKNGDSRYICDQMIGDADVHMILGGSTGQGKSVTLNSFIYGMCLEYAPWEINLTMCDAKIVEFKFYAIKTPLPHIQSIAATGDVEYLISVLENLDKDMNSMNKVFPIAGVAKIEDFRKKTGLCIPQNIIVIDEFQTMFKMAGKKLNKLNSIIDDFARLGRATGYHLLLASQELGSEITSATLGNIKIRAAMGCNSAVSTKILGNDAAKNNFGKKGQLIINTSSDNGNKNDNVHISVPYMPDSQRISIGQDIIEKSKQFGYSKVLSFYDEEDKVYESQYPEYLRTFAADSNRILLGAPSFVMKDKEQIVKLNFTGDDIENICVLVNNNKHAERYFKMLKYNLMMHKGKTQNLVLVVDNMYAKQCNAKELASSPTFYKEAKSFTNNYVLDVAFQLIYRRKLALDVDNRVFGGAEYRDVVEDVFYEHFKHGSNFDTDINKRRFYFAMSLLKTDATYDTAFGLGSKSDREAEEIKYAVRTVEMFHDYNCSSCKLVYNNLPPTFVWILGMHKLLGLGRDRKNANVQKLKKALQDSYEAAVHYMLFTATMEDMDDLLSGIRWYILDDTPVKEITKIKAGDYYPAQKAEVLGVLYDQSAPTDKCMKFKKMILDDEIV